MCRTALAEAQRRCGGPAPMPSGRSRARWVAPALALSCARIAGAQSVLLCNLVGRFSREFLGARERSMHLHTRHNVASVQVYRAVAPEVAHGARVLTRSRQVLQMLRNGRRHTQRPGYRHIPGPSQFRLGRGPGPRSRGRPHGPGSSRPRGQLHAR